MAKNRPVMICIIKHSVASEPKFHIVEMLVGVGKSTTN